MTSTNQTPIARCESCTRPCPDAFLCTDCAGRTDDDLAMICALLPELETTLTRQARTRSGRAPAEVTPAPPAAPAVLPAHLRTSHGPIALVAQPLPIDAAASDVAHDARNALSTIWRDLCETRGIDPAEALGRA